MHMRHSGCIDNVCWPFTKNKKEFLKKLKIKGIFID